MNNTIENVIVLADEDSIDFDVGTDIELLNKLKHEQLVLPRSPRLRQICMMHVDTGILDTTKSPPLKEIFKKCPLLKNIRLPEVCWCCVVLGLLMDWMLVW